MAKFSLVFLLFNIIVILNISEIGHASPTKTTEIPADELQHSTETNSVTGTTKKDDKEQLSSNISNSSSEENDSEGHNSTEVENLNKKDNEMQTVKRKRRYAEDNVTEEPNNEKATTAKNETAEEDSTTTTTENSTKSENATTAPRQLDLNEVADEQMSDSAAHSNKKLSPRSIKGSLMQENGESLINFNEDRSNADIIEEILELLQQLENQNAKAFEEARKLNTKSMLQQVYTELESLASTKTK